MTTPSDTTTMTRTFLALELPVKVKDALQRQIGRLARAIPEVRWVDAASLHLTLAFLGELDDARLEAAIQSAAVVASGQVSLSLRLAGLGTFGPAHAPRVVWVGLEGEVRRLLALQAALADELAVRGFAREARPFAPHLTLARIKRPISDAALAALARVLTEPVARATWQADAISVMKSELVRPAARYTELARWPLLGQP